MKDVNMFVCSDLHGSQEALSMLPKLAVPKEYDLMVVCGDFTTMGSVDYVADFLKRLKIKVLAVPGNCDMPDTVGVLEKAYASVHNKHITFGGWQFFGFGGSVPTSSEMPFEIEEAEIERSLRAIAVQGGVMVTHTPPYGMNDIGRSGIHGGSKRILSVANDFKVKLSLSGHMHESRGVQTLGGTVFVNPGSARNGHYASIWLGNEVKVRLQEYGRMKSKPKTY